MGETDGKALRPHVNRDTENLTRQPGPLVTVLIVNFNGGALIPDVLNSLRHQTFSDFETVVVDNGSTDGSDELVARNFPEARLISAQGNLGFAGGNNLGFSQARGQYIALINNDAIPEPQWLESLVHELEQGPDIAAVTSKVLFLCPYLAVRFRIAPPEPGSPRVSDTAGVFLGPSSGIVGCNYDKPVFESTLTSAVTNKGRVGRWIEGESTIWLPTLDRSSSADLLLRLWAKDADHPVTLSVAVGATDLGTTEVGPEDHEFRVVIPEATVSEESTDILNNAGSTLDSKGTAADRGIFKPDVGQFEQAEDVEAICGAAVLLRRAALDQVGFFDRDFFMYYEDTDLSWRLRAHGYRLRYSPSAIVRHHHAATSGEWSPLFVFYTARNRLLMIAKNARLIDFVRAAISELTWCARCLHGAAFQPSAGQRRHFRANVRQRGRIYGSLVLLLPKAFLKRAGWMRH